MKIRKAEPGDLARIVQIEGLCFPEETAFPPGMFAYLIRYSVALVACEPEETILGFVMGYTSGTYGAVYTLDVHPGYRRKRIGIELIMALEKKLEEWVQRPFAWRPHWISQGLRSSTARPAIRRERLSGTIMGGEIMRCECGKKLVSRDPPLRE